MQRDTTDSDVIVSPNPATDAIAVEVITKDGTAEVSGQGGARRVYEVYSLEGRVLRQGVYPGQRHLIDLVGLPAGTYSLVVHEGDKLITRKTFIKQ